MSPLHSPLPSTFTSPTNHWPRQMQGHIAETYQEPNIIEGEETFLTGSFGTPGNHWDILRHGASNSLGSGLEELTVNLMALFLEGPHSPLSTLKDEGIK